jgi:hypothetical protein
MSMRVSGGSTGRRRETNYDVEVDWFTGRVELHCSRREKSQTRIPFAEQSIERHGVVRRYNIGKDGRVHAVKI